MFCCHNPSAAQRLDLVHRLHFRRSVDYQVRDLKFRRLIAIILKYEAASLKSDGKVYLLEKIITVFRCHNPSVAQRRDLVYRLHFCRSVNYQVRDLKFRRLIAIILKKSSKTQHLRIRL